MVQGRRLTLEEVFGRALEDGWIVIAANVYTPDYVIGVARAMYESGSPAIIQASSDTLPILSQIHSGVVVKNVPSVDDLLRGATRLSRQRKDLEIEAAEQGDGGRLAIYLAVDHSDPLNKIFLGDETDLRKYRTLISGKPQEEKFARVEDELATLYRDDETAFKALFTLKGQEKPLTLDQAKNLLAKYLLFTEKVIMCAHVPEKGIDVDFDYVALDFSFPQDFNVSLTNVVTSTRDYYAREGKYVLVESGYGIEMEKDVLSDEEQKEYAQRVIEYVTETDIDAVSCNIGTYHGEMGTGGKQLGNLHTTLMEGVRKGLQERGKGHVIIVAHGGSSIADSCLKDLDITKLGLVKINKASVYINRLARELRDYVNSPEVFLDGKFNRGPSKGFNISEKCIEGVKQESLVLFECCGSAGKALT
jgi:fructose/tagatose bisphosphate aldolase